MGCFVRRVARGLVSSSVLACALASAAHASEPTLVDELVGTAGFPKADVEGMGDAPLTRELAVADGTREAAWAAIVRLRTDGAALAEALAGSTPPAKAKGVHARGRFHDPAQPGDVAGIEFSTAELEALADCKVAECKFKVGHEGIEALGAIDWSAPDAGARFTERFRSDALAYVDGYRKKGDAALILYADKPHPSALGTTLESLLARFTAFQRQAPGFWGYLKSYPAGRQPGMSDTLLWQMADFGYRPTLVIDHVVVDRETGVAGVALLVASKTIYANHYLAGRVQMGAVLDGATALGVPGHFLVLVDRIAFDDALSGFKRKLLGNGLRDSLGARLEYLRSLADGTR